MRSQYMDRGLIKWAPFNALNGYYSMLDEMKHRIKKHNKPVLSDDDYDDLNRNIQEAIINQSEVEVNYYDQGYIKTSYGKIKKLDFIFKTLVLTTEEKITAIDVIRIEIIT